MKIVILGWYGTETIGDRAILAGLVSFFNKAFTTYEIHLGSLYPFFSERTLEEDRSLWGKMTGKQPKIKLFDSKNSKELDNAIHQSDLVIMGGGPLMHISEMYMIEYAFQKAKKLNKTTGLLGCGVGPIFTRQHKKSLINIVRSSDMIILRDHISKSNLVTIFNEFGQSYDFSKIHVSFDPAVECCIEANKFLMHQDSNTIVVNLREFPNDYSLQQSDVINYYLKKLVQKIASDFPDHNVQLIPMHYFYIGDDDRRFLNTIKFELNQPRIDVQNENLTLEQTMTVYKNAYLNIGMRFHAIVLQTVLSGRNYLLDYTEPQKGKTYGFLQDIDEMGFYTNRYIALQNNLVDIDFVFEPEDNFKVDFISIAKKLNIYMEKLKEVTQ